MDVRLLYFDGCPSWHLAKQRLDDALARTGHADTQVTLERVETLEEAVERHFLGSPTILIDGVDPFAQPGDEPAMACRVYRADVGFEGSPSTRQLIERLKGH